MASLAKAQRFLNAERARRLAAGEPLMTAAEVEAFLAWRERRGPRPSGEPGVGEGSGE